jgi:hypothetical protein
MMRVPILIPAFLAGVATVGTAQLPDTSAYTPVGELRIGVGSASSRRSASTESGPVHRSSAAVSFAEFVARSSDGAGVQLRYETGDFPRTPSIGLSDLSGGVTEDIDGRLFLGGRRFSLVAGYLLRKFTMTADERQLGLARAGVEGGYIFSGAGMSVSIGGSYIRTLKAHKLDSLEADGIEGQTSVMYAPKGLPVYVQLGYRRDLFAIKKESNVLRRYETSRVVLSAGLQSGLSSR